MKKLLVVLLAILGLSVPTIRAGPAAVGAADVRLEIVSFRIRHFQLRESRYVEVIAELKNTGSSIVDDIDGYVELYDGDHWVDSNYAVFVYFDHLGPGETSPIYVWSTEIPNENTIDNLVWHIGGRPTSQPSYKPSLTITQREDHSQGYLQLRGEVQNAASENFVTDGVFVTFYNSAGQIIALDISSTSSSPVRWILVPGAKYPYYVYPTFSEWPASWKIQARTEPASAYPLPLEFSNLSEQRDEHDRTHVTGILRNPNTVATGEIQILVVLRDAEDNVVRHSDEMFDPLSPGESVDFDVGFYDSGVAHDSYETYAQCEATTEYPIPSQTPTATPTVTATSTSTPDATLTATPTHTVGPTCTPTHTSVPSVRVLLPCILKKSRGGP